MAVRFEAGVVGHLVLLFMKLWTFKEPGYNNFGIDR